MSEAVNMEQTADGVRVTIGNKSRVFPDYLTAAEWAESLLYSEVKDDGRS